MPVCSKCGEGANMPFSCTYCGERFCTRHRLPEKHGCSNLHLATSPADAEITEESLMRAARTYGAANRPLDRTRRNRLLALVVSILVVVGAVLSTFWLL